MRWNGGQIQFQFIRSWIKVSQNCKIVEPGRRGHKHVPYRMSTRYATIRLEEYDPHDVYQSSDFKLFYTADLRLRTNDKT